MLYCGYFYSKNTFLSCIRVESLLIFPSILQHLETAYSSGIEQKIRWQGVK